MDNKTKKLFDCEHCRFLKRGLRHSLYKDFCQEAKLTLYYVKNCPLIERVNEKNKKKEYVGG